MQKFRFLIKVNFKSCINTKSNRLASTQIKANETTQKNELNFELTEKEQIELNKFQSNDAAKKKTYLFHEFFDNEENWGENELRPLYRPGRAWTADELRLKSNSDLHKLWYVLLKEKNMLLTMETAYKKRARPFPNPERIDRVNESMKNIEIVVHERNSAFYELETGETTSLKERTVTSFMGFTYKQEVKEHYEPSEVTNKKLYEVPYLDDDAYLMQKLWKEKKIMEKEIENYDKYFQKVYDEKNLPFGRGIQKYYDRVEDLPDYVLANGIEKSNNN